MITNLSIPAPHPEVVGRILQDEAVLVHPQRGTVKVLNEVGAFIWSALDGKRAAGALAELVFERFDVARAQAEADTLEFLEALLTRGLITVEPS
jgi:hypothetical protein